MAGKFDALNVLIVVTYRPSDMLLAKHSFLQIKPDLQARGVCRELQLGFLNQAESAEDLALEFPSHRFPSEFQKLIHAKTEGSPLFMADLVRYLRDRGVIAKEESRQDADRFTEDEAGKANTRLAAAGKGDVRVKMSAQHVSARMRARYVQTDEWAHGNFVHALDTEF